MVPPGKPMLFIIELDIPQQTKIDGHSQFDWIAINRLLRSETQITPGIGDSNVGDLKLVTIFEC